MNEWSKKGTHKKLCQDKYDQIKTKKTLTEEAVVRVALELPFFAASNAAEGGFIGQRGGVTPMVAWTATGAVTLGVIVAAAHPAGLLEVSDLLHDSTTTEGGWEPAWAAMTRLRGRPRGGAGRSLVERSF